MKLGLFTLGIFFCSDLIASVSLRVPLNTNKLEISGGDCTELKSATHLLQTWFLALDPQYKIILPNECTVGIESFSNKNYLRIILDELSPEFIKKYTSLASHKDGPNCFGWVLYSLGYSHALRFVSTEEIVSHLYSTICKPVDSQDNLKTGDVLAIFRSDPETSNSILQHALIWLSPDLVSQKISMDGDSSPDLEDPKLIYDLYQIDSHCLRSKLEGCKSWIQAFRCKSAASSEFKEETKNNKILNEYIKQTADLEVAISEEIFDWNKSEKYNKNIMLKFKAELIKIRNYLNSDVSLINNPSKIKLELKINSLIKQTELY